MPHTHTEDQSACRAACYHNAISDAITDLGPTDQIRTLFTGFQKYLYQDVT